MLEQVSHKILKTSTKFGKLTKVSDKKATFRSWICLLLQVLKPVTHSNGPTRVGFHLSPFHPKVQAKPASKIL
jgi:hypothetical protein